MQQAAREKEWARMMRAALAGDSRAYHRFLTEIAPHIRTAARRRCDRFGMPISEAEDIVQEVLLAIHLKRGTWDSSRPVSPWIYAIMRNKLIDCLRRRGMRAMVPLEEIEATLESEARLDISDRMDAEQVVSRLKDPQRSIVRSISIEGTSVRETAARLKMTEVAVRVSFHRALKSLAAFYSGQAT